MHLRTVLISALLLSVIPVLFAPVFNFPSRVTVASAMVFTETSSSTISAGQSYSGYGLTNGSQIVQPRILGTNSTFDANMTFMCNESKVRLDSIANFTFSVENPSDVQISDVRVVIQFTSSDAGNTEIDIYRDVQSLAAHETVEVHVAKYTLDHPWYFRASFFAIPGQPAICSPDYQDLQALSPKVSVISFVAPAYYTMQTTVSLTRTVSVKALSGLMGNSTTLVVAVSLLVAVIGIQYAGKGARAGDDTRKRHGSEPESRKVLLTLSNLLIASDAHRLGLA